MKTKLICLLIIATTTTFHLHTMELIDSHTLLKYAMKNPFFYKTLQQDKSQLPLPDDIFDKIIAYSSHNTRKNIKETCKQLAFLTSINRLSNFIIHDFYIGDEKEKKA